MYAFDIIIANKRFTKKNNKQYDDWINYASDYVYHLERTGQVLTNNQQIIVNGNTIRIPVICPAKDSLSQKYCSCYNLATIEKLENNNGCAIEFVLTGREADNLNYKVPENSSFYILRNSLESPLLCADSFQPIPLYKIPATDHDGMDYDNIYFWNKEFGKLYGLWLSSGTYEGFAQEQLQDVYSSINQTGRELCALIEKLTGVATYYFLFNYKACPTAADKLRKCPITGKDWLLEGKTSSDFIAFKCDASRLVSELSTNSDSD